MADMAGGDKIHNKNHEIAKVNNSEMCLVNLGESPEIRRLRESHDQSNHHIAQAQATIMSIVDRLAAYYPNGYQGVLDEMPKGPARDLAISMIKRQESAIKPSPTNLV